MWTRRLFQSQSSRVVTVPPPLVVSFDIHFFTTSKITTDHDRNITVHKSTDSPKSKQAAALNPTHHRQTRTKNTTPPFAHATRSAPTSLPPFRRPSRPPS